MNITLLSLLLYLGTAGAFDDGKVVFTKSQTEIKQRAKPNVNQLSYKEIERLTDEERESFIKLINPSGDPLYNLTTKELMLIDPR